MKIPALSRSNIRVRIHRLTRIWVNPDPDGMFCVSSMLSSEESNLKMCSSSLSQMEELLDRTSKLTVTNEDDWEINEARVEDIGKSCLLGRMCTMKPFTRSLLKNILCQLWNLGDNDWDLKIKKISDKAMFLVLSFSENNSLERILGRSTWVLNAGFLILDQMTGIPTEWEKELRSFTIFGRSAHN
ncbi:hypothetical protein G4B88_013556 [Cannabis sativa]|uniref:DUF4283 domain-containing protein n=1 Tax=Cannabis sativa TaxID=3483 RepID=A0A7J6HKL7_CANSA|nr:hypothetical protein G4B88_013556 [Cannabis sativa]